MCAIAASEKAPTPLVLTPATLTLYWVHACRPTILVLVTWRSSRVTLDELPPKGESSRVQPVIGEVVLGVKGGGCEERTNY